MTEVRLAIVRPGKIARGRHVPAITAGSRFRLTSVVAKGGAAGFDVPVLPPLNSLLAAGGVSDPGINSFQYSLLYRRFGDLIRERRRDVDLAPLRLVADIMLVARRSPRRSASQ